VPPPGPRHTNLSLPCGFPVPCARTFAPILVELFLGGSNFFPADVPQPTWQVE
jgi:hypothetical protein